MKEDRSTYNPWPIGKLPKEYQRPEIDQLRETYPIDDPREAVVLFEKKLAAYTGAPHVIVLDNCTNANFLMLKWHKIASPVNVETEIVIPARTYVSVPQSILHAGYTPRFLDYGWSGLFQFDPLPCYDAAGRFTKDMYVPNSMMTLSFQIKKRIPIGKGGAILTDDPEAAAWFKKVIIEGRDINKAYDKDIIDYIGYNMYMTPEDAARGIILFDMITEFGTKDNVPDTMDYTNYTDLREQRVF